MEILKDPKLEANRFDFKAKPLSDDDLEPEKPELNDKGKKNGK
jgi:hypothetical protein